MISEKEEKNLPRTAEVNSRYCETTKMDSFLVVLAGLVVAREAKTLITRG